MPYRISNKFRADVNHIRQKKKKKQKTKTKYAKLLIINNLFKHLVENVNVSEFPFHITNLLKGVMSTQ